MNTNDRKKRIDKICENFTGLDIKPKDENLLSDSSDELETSAANLIQQ